MARVRNIKPGFFSNESLAECDPLARILFAGLWTIADREGRLEDRPKRIKVQLLPFDSCDLETLLEQLAERGFVLRYKVGDESFIQIVNFSKHQNPHKNEVESVIPQYSRNGSSDSRNGSSDSSNLRHDSGRSRSRSRSLDPDPDPTPDPTPATSTQLENNSEPTKADKRTETSPGTAAAGKDSQNTQNTQNKEKGYDNRSRMTQDKRSPVPPTSGEGPDQERERFNDLEQFLLTNWGREGRVGFGVIRMFLQDSKEFGIAAVREAIVQAAKSNVRKYTYVKAILTKKVQEREKNTRKALGEKKCRNCGHSWNTTETGSSLCPVCYPEPGVGAVSPSMALVSELAKNFAGKEIN